MHDQRKLARQFPHAELATSPQAFDAAAEQVLQCQPGRGVEQLWLVDFDALDGATDQRGRQVADERLNFGQFKPIFRSTCRRAFISSAPTMISHNSGAIRTRSASGPSNSNSSCTCNNMRTSGASCWRNLATRIMAILTMSLAEPWMGALMICRMAA